MNCYPPTTHWGSKSWADATEEELARRDLAEEFAWATLQTLTGYRLSLCALEISPGRAACDPGTYFTAPVGGAQGPFHPYLGIDGQWRNAVHRSGCRCDLSTELRLPGTVARMIAVEVDGVVLGPTAYRVENGSILVRVDGKTWPLASSAHAEPGALGSIMVTYFDGAAPDNLADWAAGKLAREYLALLEGKRCVLPSQVTAVTRQGVTFEMAQSAFSPGQATGIVEVDAYVARLNPHGLKVPSRVFSIDTMDQDRVVTSSRGSTPPTPGYPGNLVPDTALGAGYYRLEP